MNSTSHKWQFTSRFRRHAFGWRSDTPIQCIKAAIAEIKLVARKEPVIAAEGAVTLLEKLSPALEQVDSSSGALGTAVNRAIDTLVPIIAEADVDLRVRQRWLERLWQALQDDEIPYIESLGEHWGELCVTPELAIQWVDEFLPLVEHVWSPDPSVTGSSRGRAHALRRYMPLVATINCSPCWSGRHSNGGTTASGASKRWRRWARRRRRCVTPSHRAV